MAQHYPELNFTEEDLKKLQERVFQKKMEELFEEPSTYEDDDYI